MKLLVTRPVHQTAKTAQALEHLGHSVVVQPLLAIERTHVPLPNGTWDGIIVTSANAVEALRDVGEMLSELPVITTGVATKTALQDAGFSNVHAVEGSARDIAASLSDWLKTHRLVDDARLLYPCAQKTAHDFASHSKAFCVHWPVYEARAVDSFTKDVASDLERRLIDGVLLYSARTAQTFVALFSARFSDEKCPALYVMSEEVAHALPDVMRKKSYWPVEPNEAALFKLLQQ